SIAGELAHGLQQLLARVRLVRVVDDDGRQIAVRLDRDALESAAHAVEIANAALDRLGRNANDQRRADGAEPVVEIRQTEEIRFDANVAVRRLDDSAEAADVDHESINRMNVSGRRATERHRRVAQLAGQTTPVRI